MSALPFKNPQCPACCNKDTYINLVVPLPHMEEVDEYQCECGKCGLRYRTALERHIWMSVRASHPKAARLIRS
jgi:C4-type Zn-finger protein